MTGPTEEERPADVVNVDNVHGDNGERRTVDNVHGTGRPTCIVLADADARDTARAAIGIAPRGSLVLILPPEADDPATRGGIAEKLEQRGFPTARGSIFPGLE